MRTLSIVLAFFFSLALSQAKTSDPKIPERKTYCMEVEKQMDYVKTLSYKTQRKVFRECLSGVVSNEAMAAANEFLQKGMKQQKRGYYESARHHYLTAAIRDPENPESLIHLAGLYLYLGEKGQKTFPAAIIQLGRLKKYHPKSSRVDQFIKKSINRIPSSQSFNRKLEEKGLL